MTTCSIQRSWTLIAFGLLSIALLLAACDRVAKGKRFLEQVGVTNLTAYAVDFQNKGVWNTVKGQLPKEMWHESFSRHGVLQVKPYFTGFQIVLETRGRNECGIYVTTDNTVKPEDGSGIHFERLAEGIYWFEQKTRVRSIGPRQHDATSK